MSAYHSAYYQPNFPLVYSAFSRHFQMVKFSVFDSIGIILKTFTIYPSSSQFRTCLSPYKAEDCISNLVLSDKPGNSLYNRAPSALP